MYLVHRVRFWLTELLKRRFDRLAVNLFKVGQHVSPCAPRNRRYHRG